MPMSASEIEKLIKDAFPDAEVVIEDLRGDGDHYACRQEPGPAASDGLQGSRRTHGRRTARAGIADVSPDKQLIPDCGDPPVPKLEK